MREITDHLRRRIVSGELPPDRQLPSMRKLARMYGVGLPTMQGALHGLASLGFVRITHGVGVFVARARSPATVLIHACQEASPYELAIIRAGIDERMPPVAAHAARLAGNGPLPPSLRDLAFLAGERSFSRLGAPAEAFVLADLQFHRALVASVEGAEVTITLYDHIGRRLMPQLVAAARSQAADVGLDQAHLALATAITAGALPAATRLAATIARREAAWMKAATRDR